MRPTRRLDQSGASHGLHHREALMRNAMLSFEIISIYPRFSARIDRIKKLDSMPKAQSAARPQNAGLRGVNATLGEPTADGFVTNCSFSARTALSQEGTASFI
jgi:hypothetical protein